MAPQRSGGVIYVTVSMKFAVRALCMFLTVWLPAAAALPLCCWSIAYAHDHQARGKHTGSDPPHAAQHHHHESADSAAPAETPSALVAIPAYDCDRDSAEAIATTRPAKSPADMRAAAATAADVVVPQLPTHVAARSDLAPPGASSDSAFLNPLRI